MDWGALGTAFLGVVSLVLKIWLREKSEEEQIRAIAKDQKKKIDKVWKNVRDGKKQEVYLELERLNNSVMLLLRKKTDSSE